MGNENERDSESTQAVELRDVSSGSGVDNGLFDFGNDRFVERESRGHFECQHHLASEFEIPDVCATRKSIECEENARLVRAVDAF